jgi:hypothetical protein
MKADILGYLLAVVVSVIVVGLLAGVIRLQ